MGDLRLFRTAEPVSAPNRRHSFERRERDRRIDVDHDAFHTPDHRLQEGDCIRMVDGSFHFIQYVNSSGAYAVPLQSVNRDVRGHTIAFTAGGRTISVQSTVEVINPLSLGGNSIEYQRYVRMAKSMKESGRGKGMANVDKGVTFTDFASEPLTEADMEAAEAEGQSVAVESGTPNTKAGKGMAKKAKANGKAAKREKAPKTTRLCTCGCGAETMGYFAPGHDAKYHGWQKKLADGRMEPKDVPTSVRNKMGLVATKTGYKATTPEFYKH